MIETTITPNMRVEEIMRRRGVTKKRAFLLRRQASAAAHNEPVPNNQRERVLDVLQRLGRAIRTSNDLTAALQSEGYAIDDHDATKTLWSLQKTGHVRFRERPHGLLFAIKLTQLGEEHRPPPATMPQFVEDRIPEQLLEEAGPEDLSDVKEVAQRAAAIQQAVNGLSPEDLSGVEMAGRPEPPETWSDPSIFQFDNGGFPEFRAIRDRARNAKKLAAAAAILEEVGEDEIALQLMTRVEFTPLEKEVIELLERYEEN